MSKLKLNEAMKKSTNTILFDENNNITICSFPDGSEHWFCDEEEIRTITNDGTEFFYENDDGFFYEYDDQGRCIYEKDSDGYEKWSEYDDQGRCIHERDSEGYEEWSDFDENGDRIYYKWTY